MNTITQKITNFTDLTKFLENKILVIQKIAATKENPSPFCDGAISELQSLLKIIKNEE